MQILSVGVTSRTGKRRAKSAGFSIVKVIVAVAIALLVASVAIIVAARFMIPRLGHTQNMAKRAAARAQMRTFNVALLQYTAATSAYPSTAQGLQALWSKPENQAVWDGPYTRPVMLDPWAHPYIYKYPGQHGDEPDIVSLGADGQPGGDGDNADIGSWDDK